MQRTGIKCTKRRPHPLTGLKSKKRVYILLRKTITRISRNDVEKFNRSHLLSLPLYKALNLNCSPFVKQISNCRLSKVIRDLNAVFQNNPSVII